MELDSRMSLILKRDWLTGAYILLGFRRFPMVGQVALVELVVCLEALAMAILVVGAVQVVMVEVTGPSFHGI
ncbi:hypothetical protein LWI28_006066 [Acer negundo]|uniref:Uncharacterized protein n=1 Tax=Acer negundo TaxID=4023 RepID=A0AAD5IFS3_ACENE|nr:hypothetical protein LWI28_006066 [Acer negundo]